MEYSKPLPSPYLHRLVKHVYYSLKNDQNLSRDLARYYGMQGSTPQDNDDYLNKSSNVRRSTSLMATGNGIMNQKQISSSPQKQPADYLEPMSGRGNTPMKPSPFNNQRYSQDTSSNNIPKPDIYANMRHQDESISPIGEINPRVDLP